MSWFVKSIGTKKAVIADVRKQLDAQDHLTGMQIVQRIQSIPDPASEVGKRQWDQYTHVRVEGSGHGGAIANLVIEGINLAPEPVEAQAPEPVAQAAPPAASQENQSSPA